MDIVTDVKKWLKQMGYDRNVDNINFKGMITPATTHIWMQLIKNVRPKQEIELIRKNIIINRLSSKRGLPPAITEIINVHPLKELDIYNNKLELEKRLEILKHTVRENEEKLKDLMMQNRMKYATVENLRYEVESNERSTFLLKAKIVQLKKEITKIEDIVHSVKRLTPVEEINSTDEKEVLDTLKTCAQKLEVHVKQQKINDENSAVFRINPTINSTFIENSTFIRMSAKKKTSSAKKQLIPPQCRRALTPRALNSVYSEMPDLGKTFLSDESFLMASGNTSNIDITFNETKVKGTLQGLVHSYNRRLIWNCLQQIFTECKGEVSTICMNTDAAVIKRDSKNLAMVKLYHIHVKNELLTRKHEVTVKSLEAEIDKFKNMVLVQANNFNQAKTALEYQMKAAGLRAALKFMQKEIVKESSLTTNENEIVSLNEKLHHVKEQININLREIEQYLNCFKTANNKLLRTRDRTVSLVEKLNQFVEDTDWTEPLSKMLHVQEIEAFSSFPLDQNRSMLLGNRKVYTRDVCISSIPYQKDVDKDTLYKFVSLIHKPCCFPEKILYEIAENMVRVENFERLNSKIKVEENVPKYTLRELNESENYMEKALQNFNKLIENDASRMTSNLGKLKEIVDIWLEMPFGRYISNNRLVNQHNFEFYERQYDYYYNQL